MSAVNKLEDVFTPGMLLVMQGISDLNGAYHGHRDGAHGRDYIVMLKRVEGKIAEVRVALVNMRPESVKAKLIFRFDTPVKFFFEYGCDESILSAEELTMEQEGRLSPYMVERLVETGMIAPSFAAQLQEETPTGAA